MADQYEWQRWWEFNNEACKIADIKLVDDPNPTIFYINESVQPSFVCYIPDEDNN